METLQFTIYIKAEPSRVWECLWLPENYKAWTRIFSEGSYYSTESFSEGSRIHLLTPSGEGMYSIIERLEENRFLAFRHLGWVSDFKEQPIEGATEVWTNAMESYRIDPAEDGVALVVHVDTVEEYIGHMNEKFPLALEELKRIAEN